MQAYYLRLRRTPPPTDLYNGLQRLAYSAIIVIATVKVLSAWLSPSRRSSGGLGVSSAAMMGPGPSISSGSVCPYCDICKDRLTPTGVYGEVVPLKRYTSLIQ